MILSVRYGYVQGFTSPLVSAITSEYLQQVQRLPRRIGEGARDVATQSHQVDADTGTRHNTSLSRIKRFESKCAGEGSEGVSDRLADCCLAGFILMPPKESDIVRL